MQLCFLVLCYILKLMGWLMGGPSPKAQGETMQVIGWILITAPLAAMFVDCLRDVKAERLRRDLETSNWIVEIEEDCND